MCVCVFLVFTSRISPSDPNFSPFDEVNSALPAYVIFGGLTTLFCLPRFKGSFCVPLSFFPSFFLLLNRDAC